MEYHAKEKPKYFTNCILVHIAENSLIERYFNFLVEKRSISSHNHSYYIATR